MRFVRWLALKMSAIPASVGMMDDGKALQHPRSGEAARPPAAIRLNSVAERKFRRGEVRISQPFLKELSGKP
jgi:hypothetical protein